jgi:hypothetical protein
MKHLLTYGAVGSLLGFGAGLWALLGTRRRRTLRTLGNR